MKRRIVTLLIFLLLGAIVNVAVAWGCSSRSWLSRGWVKRTVPVGQVNIDWWRAHAPDGFPEAPLRISEMGDLSTRVLVLTALEGETRYYAHKAEYGWPLASLELSSWFDSKSKQRELRNAIGLFGSHEALGGTAPLMPIWPGFAINTLFYAAILWLLFTARLTLPYARRRRRIKRGLCPACAYPVGTSDLCTECGKPVNPRKPASVEPA